MIWALSASREHVRQGINGWNRFWFEPADPTTLGLIRLLAGCMILYTHLIWSLQLEAFFGSTGMISEEVVATNRASGFAWSFLNSVQSPASLWTIHIASLVVLFLFAIGCWTRITSIFAFLIVVNYVNRVPIALFGLDQINGLLALYLMIGPSGEAFSVDRWSQRGRAGRGGAMATPSVSANIATRLIQIHMCIIYLFAGCGKLFGESWWNGTALWFAFGNYEYQSVDMTWLAKWPILINAMTHVTIAWEISYVALIWPHWTRPFVLAMAIPLHLGIAIVLGMITFGSVMLIANLAFVSPLLIRAAMEKFALGSQPMDTSVLEGSPDAKSCRRRRK